MLRVLNQYCHGYVLAPMAIALERGGLFRLLSPGGQVPRAELAAMLQANTGPLQVALEMFAVLDWLRLDREGVRLGSRSEERELFQPEMLRLYDHAPADLIGDPQGAEVLSEWLDKVTQGWGCEGALSLLLDAPAMLSMLVGTAQTGKTGLLAAGDEQALPGLASMRRVLLAKRWASQDEKGFKLGGVGKFMFGRAMVGGVTVSYRPLLRQAEELLFGSARSLFQISDTGESHIDRTLNVQSSGFQHEKFFAKLDSMLDSVFDLEHETGARPSYVADMGCGDGSLLRRIHDKVAAKGFPVTMVGLDLNQAALDEAAKTLAGVPHLLLPGDIGDPTGMVRAFVERTGDDPERILHVRSFLDHNRCFVPPRDTDGVEANDHPLFRSLGIDEEGGLIPPEVLHRNLVEHLREWAAILGSRNGLMCLEVHSMSRWAKAAFFDIVEGFHFDALHALSRQYLCPPGEFLAALAEAGLFPRGEVHAHPDGLPVTRITIGFYEPRPYSVRHAEKADLDHLSGAAWRQEEPLEYQEAEEVLRGYPEACFTVLDGDGRAQGMLLCQPRPLDNESQTRKVVLRGVLAFAGDWTDILLQHMRTIFSLQDGAPVFAGSLAQSLPS